MTAQRRRTAPRKTGSVLRPSPVVLLLAGALGCQWGGAGIGSPPSAQAMAAPATSAASPPAAVALTDPATRLVPLKPRTVDDDRRLVAQTLFCQARWHEIHDRREAALRTYRRALEHDPNAAAIHWRTAVLYQLLGRSGQALRHYRKVVDLEPTNAKALRKLGRLLAEKGRDKDALRAYERAIASPQIKTHSYEHLLLACDLYELYRLNRQLEKAAELVDVLVGPLVTPSAYGLSGRQHAELFERDVAWELQRFAKLKQQVKRFDAALDLYKKAHEVSGGQTDLDLQVADLRADQGKLQEALRACYTHLNKPDDQKRRSSRVKGFRTLAHILEKSDQKDRALRELTEAVEKYPRDGVLKDLLAEKCLDYGKLDRAEKICHERIEENPTARNPAYGRLVKIYVDTQAYQKLLLALGQWFDQDRRRRAAGNELRKISADEALAKQVARAGGELLRTRPKAVTYGVAFCGAVLADVARDEDGAVALYAHCITLNAANPEPYQYLGQIHWRKKRYAEAAKVFRQAIDAAASDTGEFHRWLAMMLELMGKTDKALEAIRVGMARSPGRPEPLNVLAWIYYHAGKIDRAVRQYELVIEQFRGDPAAHEARIRLASILADTNRFAEAEKLLLEALAEHPDDATTNNNLGYMWAERGIKLPEAEGMIRKAVEAEPDNGAFLDSLGWVLFKQGQYAEARKQLERASQQDDVVADPVIWDHLGDVCFRLDAIQKARSYWTKALKLTAEQKSQRRGVDATADAREGRIRQKLRTLPTTRKGLRTDRENP